MEKMQISRMDIRKSKEKRVEDKLDKAIQVTLGLTFIVIGLFVMYLKYRQAQAYLFFIRIFYTRYNEGE